MSSASAPGSSGTDGEVRRERQLLEADEARALGGGETDPLGQRGAVLARIGMPALLHQPDPERLALRGSTRAEDGGTS